MSTGRAQSGSTSDAEERKQLSTLMEKSLSTEARKPLSTEARKPLSTEARKPLSTEARKPLSTEARKPLSTEARKPFSTLLGNRKRTSDVQIDEAVLTAYKQAPRGPWNRTEDKENLQGPNLSSLLASFSSTPIISPIKPLGTSSNKAGIDARGLASIPPRGHDSECESGSEVDKESLQSPNLSSLLAPFSSTPIISPIKPLGTSSNKAGIDARGLASIPPRSDDSECESGSEVAALVDSPSRPCPIAPIAFGNQVEMWKIMCHADKTYLTDPNFLDNHPELSPKMRSIVLQWLMDMCVTFELQRETLYLAVNYVDRYLSKQKDLRTRHYQLIGVTCLYVASKMEESRERMPYVGNIAYMTDQLYSVAEIIDMELVVATTLNWQLCPVTPCNWINLYFQILALLAKSGYDAQCADLQDIRCVLSNPEGKVNDEHLAKVQYVREEFVKTMRIMDLSILDVESLKYKPSLLAAAAISYTKGRPAAVYISGFSWEQMAPCVQWMRPFASVVRKENAPFVTPSITNVPPDMLHLIQSCAVSLKLLKKAHRRATKNRE